MAAAALALACGGGDGVGPVIDAVSPSTGQRGTPVTIAGDRFCGDGEDAAGADGVCATPPAGLVNFVGTGVARAQVTSWRDEEIVVTVPATAEDGVVEIVVVLAGVSSNSADFDVLP